MAFRHTYGCHLVLVDEVAVCFFVMLLGGYGVIGADEHPNIVKILCDDLGRCDLACYGNVRAEQQRTRDAYHHMPARMHKWRAK